MSLYEKMWAGIVKAKDYRNSDLPVASDDELEVVADIFQHMYDISGCERFAAQAWAINTWACTATKETGQTGRYSGKLLGAYYNNPPTGSMFFYNGVMFLDIECIPLITRDNV